MSFDKALSGLCCPPRQSPSFVSGMFLDLRRFSASVFDAAGALKAQGEREERGESGMGLMTPTVRKRWSYGTGNRPIRVGSGRHGNLSKAGQL